MYCISSSSQPKLIPIDSSKIDDPHYRYKMRQLQILIRKNRTHFVNIVDIAKNLHIPPDYLIAYIGQKLSARFAYNVREEPKERAYICAVVELDILSEIVEEYIQKMVLCMKCKLPELVYIPGNRAVKLLCQSCGHMSFIMDLDLNGKFIKYIRYHQVPSPKSIKMRGKEDEIGFPVIDDDKGSDKEDWALDTSEEAVEARRLAVSEDLAIQ